MYGLTRRLSLTQSYPLTFRKLHHYRLKITDDLVRNQGTPYLKPGRFTKEYSTYKLKEMYRNGSICAAFSSIAPTVSTCNDDLMAVFPEIVSDLTQAASATGLAEVAERVPQMLEYNVLGGKRTLPELLMATFEAFAAPEQLTKENLHKIHILGWCCELGLTSFMITDDIMDRSEMRRGQPCWYRNADNGMLAINDAIIIRQGIFVVLRRHFQQDPLYPALLDHFENIIFLTEIGQCLALKCTRDGTPQLDLFTRARHDGITKYKTAVGLYFPVAIGMLLAGVGDKDIQNRAETLMLESGKLFQAQDEVMGKDTENDIKEGKCTWLAVTALERASPEQRGIMERCYGSADSKDIQAIRDLYADLKIPHLFSFYEKEVYNRCCTQIEQNFSGKPQKMFQGWIGKMRGQKR